jgi:hypothetical protein
MLNVKKTVALATALFFGTNVALAEQVDARATVLFDFGNGWSITNSMVTSWLVSLAVT